MSLNCHLLLLFTSYYDDDATLITEIFNSEPSDEGDYQCSASVEGDERNITFTLTVEGCKISSISPMIHHIFSLSLCSSTSGH